MVPTTVGSPSRVALLVLGVVAVVYAALYARVTRFQYVWDDIATIRDSPQFDRPLAESLRVTQHGHIDETLTKLREVAPEHESYRPLLFLTFAAEVKLFGRSPAVMHLTNAVLGFLAALVAFAVASALLRSRTAGAVVAAIFALHPLQVEPLSYVSARADLLSGLLALASVGLALLAAERQRWARVALVAASCLLFAGSLFAKEGTVALPLALAAVWAIDRRRRLLAPCLALLAVVPAYFAVRALVLSGAPAMAHGGGMLRGALAVPGLVLNYLSLFVAPTHLSIVRPLRPELVVAGWILGGLMVGPLLWHLRRGQAPLPPAAVTALAGLGWATATVGPSAVVAVLMGVAADRYAHLPMFGFALGAVALGRALWQARPRSHRIAAVATGAWALLCLSVTYLAVEVWQDPFHLYANAMVAEPESSAARYGLGVVFAKLGLWPQATNLFEAATRLDPANLRAWSNLSVAYQTRGRLADGERAARRAIHLSDGTHFRSWYNLATVQQRQGKEQEACTSLERALAINPYYAKAEAEAVKSCGRAPRVSDNAQP
jgi:tetratricopeptide (TPR) repeat protein